MPKRQEACCLTQEVTWIDHKGTKHTETVHEWACPERVVVAPELIGKTDIRYHGQYFKGRINA